MKEKPLKLAVGQIISIDDLAEEGFEDTNNRANSALLLKKDYQRLIVKKQQDNNYLIVAKYEVWNKYEAVETNDKKGGYKLKSVPEYVNENIQRRR